MFQLNIRHILERSRLYFGKKEIVSRIEEGLIFRYTYKDLYKRVCRLANALENLGFRKDRVASMAWNTHRHLELHLAIPAMGGILHTVNLRFTPEEIIYTINKARDKILFLDPDQIPTIETIHGNLETLEAIVIMGHRNVEKPSINGIKVYNYEELLENASDKYDFPDIEERSPAIICFTSGTTGKPKGVVYTHRGIFLRAMASCLVDTQAISERDVFLHVVPMFHISSWFMIYAATLAGSKQVFPGPRPKPETLYNLIKSEGVTVSDGVPTVWIDFLNYVRQFGKKEDISSLKRIFVGGSAPPKALIKVYKEELGIQIVHAWGMTETYNSAVGFMMKSYLESLPDEAKIELMAMQGLPFPGIEVMIVDEKGNPLPWDGKSVGELLVRGAWVINEYYEDPEVTRKSFYGDWLRTGDLARINEEGYIEIVDRVKDVIKSGGEWISSVKLENEAMAHPAVLEATAIAVLHPKWGERPLLIVKLKPEFTGKVTKENILNFLRERLPKWWVPDDIVFVEEIPKTSTGKFDKKLLREMFKNYYGGEWSGT
jgi:fatty-acyl-CoA synthase